MFFTFGYINAFGVYEDYYLNTKLPSESPSNIAWIGSLQLFFQFFGGLVSGPITDINGPRIILIPSSILFVASLMLTSICHSYYQILLAQGVLGGLASGLAYAPSVAILQQYFLKRRALAMGIASSGSSLGGVIFPVILNRLLNQSSLGFSWTLRILGFLVLVLCIVACITVVPRKDLPRRKGNYFVLSAWKKPGYTIQVAGLFFVFWGMFTPFFYLPTYAREHGMDVNLALYTIAILNAGSLIGRLISGPLVSHVGRFNLLAFSCFASGILIFSWLRITSSAPIIVYSVLYGFWSGIIIALFPTTIAAVAESPTEIGSLMGMAMGVYSLAGLTGAPITGAMIDRYGGFEEAIIFSGSVVIGGSILILAVRCCLPSAAGWVR